MWRRLALLPLIGLAMAAQAEDAPREKLNATLSDLKSSQENARALQSRLAGTQKEVNDLREQSTDLAADMQDAERRVDAEEKRTGQLNARLAEKEKEFAARKQEYADTIASLLRVQRLPPTAVMADSAHVSDVLRTAQVMQEVNGALAARAAQLRGELEALTKLRNEATASKARLASESADLNEQRKRLDRDLAKRQDAQKQLSSDLAATQARVAELSEESQSLQELIGKLEANRVAMAQKGTPEKRIASTRQGRWKLPVSGKVLHRFGERKSENETFRGLVLASRPGGTVVAPAAGEVVFTGPFRDYGRMVLVKHGNGMISLLAGMGRIAVALNQQVGAGEPLGSMGEEASPSLYYELREDSKPIDPADWFANLGAGVASE